MASWPLLSQKINYLLASQSIVWYLLCEITDIDTSNYHRYRHRYRYRYWYRSISKSKQAIHKRKKSLYLYNNTTRCIRTKKPDILYNEGRVQFTERKLQPLITILPERFPAVWIKKYACSISEFKLQVSIRIYSAYYIYYTHLTAGWHMYTNLWFVGVYALTYTYRHF